MIKDLAIVKLTVSVFKNTQEKIRRKREELRTYTEHSIEEAKRQSATLKSGSEEKPNKESAKVIKAESKEELTSQKTAINETKEENKVVTKKAKSSTKSVSKESSKKIKITKGKSDTKSEKSTKSFRTMNSSKALNKREEKIKRYAAQIKKYYGEVDDDFLRLVVKNLGPSIYNKDAESVSCSDPKELDRVKKNFLQKKLALTESDEKLDSAIKEVCETLKGVRNKYRATFYYALAKKFKKESMLS